METFAQRRITKDIHELELPETCKMEFPDPNDLLNFCLVIAPDEASIMEAVFNFPSKLAQTILMNHPKSNV